LNDCLSSMASDYESLQLHLQFCRARQASRKKTILTEAPVRHVRGYLPTLDGWRALAILAVMFHHNSVYRLGWLSTQWIHDYGARGVDLFFALSGILICTRLLEEEQIRGRIDIKGFYIRRVCRIQPAAWAYLAFVGVLMLFHAIGGEPKEILYSVLLVRNILPQHPTLESWYTAHYWSLSVEEHFYLLLPGFLLLFRRYRIWLMATSVVLLEVWRNIVFRHPRLQFGWLIEFRTDLAVEGILLAALVALLLRRSEVLAWLRRWLRPWAAWLIAGALCTAVEFHQGRVDHFALICIYPLMIVSTLLHPTSLTGRVLELPPVRFIGRISYSLYLWQMLFFTHYVVLPSPRWRLLQLVQTTGLRYVAVLGFGLASYYLLERPMMRLGHRLAKPATPGRDGLEDSNEPRAEVRENVSVPRPA
jgi:peptidoglycan/LPS O-acetylase OafA/YrhL